jgi:hypothetical protein
MLKNKIIIKGARAHNLKNIDVEIPRDKLVVITDLCRRTEEICGIVICICKAVFRSDGQAGC